MRRTEKSPGGNRGGILQSHLPADDSRTPSVGQTLGRITEVGGGPAHVGDVEHPNDAANGQREARPLSAARSGPPFLPAHPDLPPICINCGGHDIALTAFAVSPNSPNRAVRFRLCSACKKLTATNPTAASRVEAMIYAHASAIVALPIDFTHALEQDAEPASPLAFLDRSGGVRRFFRGAGQAS